MGAVLARWRATYTPGNWIVLSGPTSLVVLQPAPAELSGLINTLWEEVLASASIFDLASKFAVYNMDQMPSFGAFFWSADGMRSLVRGDVLVKDVSTGAIVADGHGIQTWSEVGLGAIDRISVVMQPGGESTPMHLPLVVGAVQAASVSLDASWSARVVSAQGVTAADQLADPVIRASTEGTSADAVARMENADTELMKAPIVTAADDDPATTEPFDPPTPHPQANLVPPTLARLVLSDGSTLDLEEPVRIGRAPSPDQSDPRTPRLVTVHSPTQDISRNHVQVAPEDGQIVVTDLHSTNGTILVGPGPGANRRPLVPGEPVSVPVGSLLELGDGVTVLIEPPR